MAPPHLPSLDADPRSLPSADESTTVLKNLGPLAARSILLARDAGDAGNSDTSAGVIPPGAINNKVFFALFGIIGAAFVITGIWFFFWAKNGGFYFGKNDWDDYKSTVLRRRGPNGTLLSGATPSTNLGGGSIYKDVADDGSTEDTRTTITGITAGASDVAGREKRRRNREQREREKDRRREEKTKKAGKEDKQGGAGESPGVGARLHKARKVGADGVLIDEEAEAAAQEHLRSYRHEKAARVGGLNKQREGRSWDDDGTATATATSATGPAESDVTDELMNNRERTPTSTPTKNSKAGGGIRKVYSTADRNAERESERIRAEARRLQEKGRAAAGGGGSGGRRDFSWQQSGGRGGDEGASTHVPGSWTESEVGSDLGTKTYRHSLGSGGGGGGGGGGTATTDFAYAEEKRRKRREAGYRRGRDDGFTEDDH